ncbi:MAG: hypothetical protein ACK4Y5_20830 [Acetobacteraceae bacterium]|jgi:hypothetical protein
MKPTIGTLSDRSFNNYLSILEGSSKLSPATQLSILHSMRHNFRAQDFAAITQDIAQKAKATGSNRSSRDILMTPTQGVGRGRSSSSVVPVATAARRASTQSVMPVQKPVRGGRQLDPTILSSRTAAINPLSDFPLTLGSANAPLVFTPPVL